MRLVSFAFNVPRSPSPCFFLLLPFPLLRLVLSNPFFPSPSPPPQTERLNILRKQPSSAIFSVLHFLLLRTHPCRSSLR